MSGRMRRLIGLLVAGAMLLGMSGCSPLGSGRITVTALMGDSAGLFVGNDVGILGVRVGRVTAIKPEGTQVRVTMEIDKDQPVPAGAGAVVVARSVATDRYVEMTPVYKGGPRLEDGAVIDQDRTRTPVDFDDVLSALNSLATGIVGKGPTANAVGNIINSGADALEGKGVAFNQAVTSLSKAVDGLSGQRGNISQTVASLDTLTKTIAANQATVRTFINQVAAASQMLAEERKNFRTALRSMSEAVEIVAVFARDNRSQVIKSFDQATDLMQSMMKEKATVAQLLETMPLALQNLQKINDNGWLRVVLDPTSLLPLLNIISGLCGISPIPVCTMLHPLLQTLQDLLGGILGPLGGLLGGQSSTAREGGSR